MPRPWCPGGAPCWGGRAAGRGVYRCLAAVVCHPQGRRPPRRRRRRHGKQGVTHRVSKYRGGRGWRSTGNSCGPCMHAARKVPRGQAFVLADRPAGPARSLSLSVGPRCNVSKSNRRHLTRAAMRRAASHYPSRKRQDIIQDIRLDFKDHMTASDPKLLLRYRSQALSGLAGLLQYSSERHASGERDWQVGPVRHPDPTDSEKEPTRR